MEEVIELINKYWRFDNNQQPMSSWHEKQDLLKKLSEMHEANPVYAKQGDYCAVCGCTEFWNNENQ